MDLEGTSECDSAGGLSAFALRLYRDIKSCASALGADAAVAVWVGGMLVGGIAT